MIRKITTYSIIILLSLLSYSQNSNLRFEKNKGQWNKTILYKADFKQGKVFLLQNKINILILDSNNLYYHPHSDKQNLNKKEKYTIFSIQPYKASFDKIETENQLQGYTNYFCGNNKNCWQNNVPSFQTVIYKNIYPNIDWEIASYEKFPKHSYIVNPGGDATMIKTLYKGVKNIIEEKNKLFIITANGTIEEDKLFVFQKEDNKIKHIEAEYRIEQTDKGFLVSYIIDNYDKSKQLIIDPSLVFCTYSGAHSDNWGMTSCYDKNGFMISGGIIYGNEYPTTEGAYDSTYSDNWDCVITKYDSLGQNLIFSTFLGGEYCEMPHSMIVNNNDEIVIFGTTGSEEFPVSDNAFQKEFKKGSTINYENSLKYTYGTDIFVSTLNAKGTELLASTYIGGSNNDGFNFKEYYGNNLKTLYNGNDSLYANFGDCARGEIITDDDNNVYIASCTFSSNFPTTNNAYKKNLSGNQDAVVFKLDKSLSSLIYSTYVGGAKEDAAYSIDIDTMDRAYVCGGTTSHNFPTSTNAYNSNYNGGTTDAFLFCLSSDGSQLEHSTLFGSSEYDQAFFVRLDKNSYPYIFGQTKAEGSTLIHNANYAIPNSGQFVAKFSPQLDSLCLSTVFGSGDGMINISPSGFAVDVCGRIYCAGWGRIFKYFKENFGFTNLGTENLETTPDAYMSNTDGTDFYIMSMTADCSALDYATFFGEYDNNIHYGNDHVDGGTSRFDRYGNFYLTICASCSGSQGIPTTDKAYSSSNNSQNCNIASAKLSIHNDFAVADFSCTTINCINNNIQFTNHSRGDSFQWFFGDNSPVSTAKNPTHSYNKGGEYIIKLVVLLNDGCKLRDTITKKILVLDNKANYLDTLSVCKNKPINIGIENLYLTSQDNVSFSWTPSSVLSNASIPNPYATITTPTLFRLIVTKDGCVDTLYRFVDIEAIPNEIADTLEFCSIPHTYYIENSVGYNLICSRNREITDTIAMIDNNKAVIIDNFKDKYLYIQYSKNGCYDIDSVFLQFKGIKFDLDLQHAGCENDTTGSAKIKLITDKNKIHYKWSCSDKDTCFVDNLAAGTYSIKISNEEDTCCTEIKFTIFALTQLNIEHNIKNSDCKTLCNGNININVTGGAAPYTFLWDNGSTQNNISNLCAGNYTVTVTDSVGCSTKSTFEVKNSYNLDIQLQSTMNNCLQGCSAIINTSVKNGQEPYKYTWNSGQTEKNIKDLCNGDYIVIVEDKNGCKDTAQTTITNIDAFKDFSAWADKYMVYDGTKIHLSSTYIDGAEYSWIPSNDLSQPHKNETDAVVYQTTTYTAYATDNKGCSKSDTVNIKVEYVNCDKPNIFIPNAFSPNNDGKNDILYVSGDYIMSMDLTIYNRWGEKVFHSTDIKDGWDGKYHNQDCAAGVYYYKLEIHCEGGKQFLSGGDITLIR